jgi:Leucine Rich repeat
MRKDEMSIILVIDDTLATTTVKATVDPTMRVYDYIVDLEKHCQEKKIRVPVFYAFGKDQYLDTYMLSRSFKELKLQDDPHTLKLEGFDEIKDRKGIDTNPYKLFPLPTQKTLILTIPDLKKPHKITSILPSTATIRDHLFDFQNQCHAQGIAIPIAYSITSRSGAKYYISRDDVYGDVNRISRREPLTVSGEYTVDQKEEILQHLLGQGKDREIFKLYPLPGMPFNFISSELSGALKRQVVDTIYLHRLLGQLTEFQMNSTLVCKHVLLTTHLLRQNRTIRLLDMSDLRIFSSSISAEMTNALGQMIIHNHTITSVNFYNTKMNDNVLKILCEALYSNTSIRFLYLGFNKFEEKGIESIAQLIRRNRTIEFLGLDFNNIRDTGIQILAAALKSNFTLKSLDLNDNPITDVGGVVLAKIVKNNHSLTALHLRNSTWGIDSVEAFIEAFQSNRSIVLRAPAVIDLKPGQPGYDQRNQRAELLDSYIYENVFASFFDFFPSVIVRLVSEYCLYKNIQKNINAALRGYITEKMYIGENITPFLIEYFPIVITRLLSEYCDESMKEGIGIGIRKAQEKARTSSSLTTFTEFPSSLPSRACSWLNAGASPVQKH